MLTWQAAAVIAAVVFVGGWIALFFVTGPKVRLFASFVRESGVILALYALWQYAGGITLAAADQAVHRGTRIWQAERSWHLPSEAWLQRGIVHHPLLIQAGNIFYATMHFTMLIAMLFWLYARHREAYARARMTIVLTTTACLLVGLVPVAPPRLINVGMVDTAVAYGQSVYTVSAIGTDQYAAMPSVHVAWAALIPVVVIMTSRSKWRWLILLHFFVTVYVVIVTANHYWADGIVAIALLALSLAVQAVAAWAYRRWRLFGLTRSTADGAIIGVGESDDVGAH